MVDTGPPPKIGAPVQRGEGKRPPPKNGAPMQRGEGKRPPPKIGAPMQRGEGKRAQHSIPTVPRCPISTQPQIKGDSEHVCLFSGSQ